MDLPEHVVRHPVIQALNEGTNDLVTWSNVCIFMFPRCWSLSEHFFRPPKDIFSYNVEQSRGDTHNMIVILMNYHGHTLQSAIDFVGELCRQTIDAFVENRKLLPSWGPNIDNMVDGYVQGLQDWITGSLHWSFMTKRYFQERGAEVKRTRFVKLLPREEPPPKEQEVTIKEEPISKVESDTQFVQAYFCLLCPSLRFSFVSVRSSVHSVQSGHCHSLSSFLRRACTGSC